MHPIEFVFGLLGLIAVGIAIMLFGEAFRAHIFLFLAIWLFLPALSVVIRKWGIFEAKNLRQLRTGFMIFVVAISWYVFIGWDDIRNHIGKNYIDGYRHWTIETGENDNGETTYGQDWTAKNASGRRVLNVLQVLALILAVGSPVITWKGLESAIRQIERREDEYLAGVDQTDDKV